MNRKTLTLPFASPLSSLLWGLAALLLTSCEPMLLKDTVVNQVQAFQVGGNGAIPAPQFSLPAGQYSSDYTLAITDSVPGVTIRYTTDGSTPTDAGAGNLYTGPVTLPTSSSTITAIAYKTGWVTSATKSGTYQGFQAGSLDTSFGSTGIGSLVSRISGVTAMGFQSSGKIILAGTVNH